MEITVFDWWQQEKRKLLMKNLFFILILHIASCSPRPTAFNSETFNKTSEGYYILRRSEDTSKQYENAAVATSSQQCAQVGIKILQKGGSAVDSAIATVLCEGVVSPQSLGIGGGFLMTIWDASEKKAYFLNAREYAPEKASEMMFHDDTKFDASKGGRAVAIPGEIAGYWEAHQKFGKLPWADLFEDAIKICEEGSHVSRFLANDILKMKEDLYEPEFSSLKNLLTSTLDPEKFVDVGHKIKRETLVHSLKKIRDHGAEVFYRGEIAENLVQDIQKAGGIITLDDFKNYEAQWKEPVNTTINGKIMYSAPPPGSGAVLSFMMNVLQDLIPAPNNKIMWQRIAETFKWAYARRSELGDFIERPEYVSKRIKSDCKINLKDYSALEESGYSFVEQNLSKWDKDCLISLALRKLLSKDYATQIRTLIKDNETSNDYSHYQVTRKGRIDLGTSHTSIYAEDGSAVSVTSTINQRFGSLVLSESTGIILNNEMDDYSYPNIKNGFDVEPSEFNYVRNGSSNLRPMSSMSPTIILDENQTVRLIIGGAGGTKITTGVAQAIILNLLMNIHIKEAVDHPRIHHNLWPMAVQKEFNFDPEILEYLKNIGHDIEDWLIMENTLAAISIDGSNNIEACADYRREGGVSGY